MFLGQQILNYIIKSLEKDVILWQPGTHGMDAGELARAV